MTSPAESRPELNALLTRARGTSATFGDFRDHAGRILEENRCRSLVSGFTRLSLTRGAVTVTAPATDASLACPSEDQPQAARPRWRTDGHT